MHLAWLFELFTVGIGTSAEPSETSKNPLAAVKRFGYQLQKLDVRAAAASSADLLVVEPHEDTRSLTRDDVAMLQKKPDGSQRLILAYLLIGEAEDYRPYWKKEWKAELYATAGVPEYWVIDLVNQQLHVFRGPTALPKGLGGSAYRSKQTLGPTESITPVVASQASVNIADLLP